MSTQLVKPGMTLIVQSNLPQVKVMAVADSYAMVRRKGAIPFVIAVKHLISLNRLDKV